MIIVIFSLLQTMVGLLCSCSHRGPPLGEAHVDVQLNTMALSGPVPIGAVSGELRGHFSLRPRVVWGFEDDNPTAKHCQNPCFKVRLKSDFSKPIIGLGC